MDTALLDLAVALRHTLHAHPECSCQEHTTKQILMDFLKAHTNLELVDMGPWFYALCRGKGPGAIAFRADFDALPIQEDLPLPYRSQHPGVSHKCGHDGHSAALALFALILDRETPPKDVYLIFQHGEEIGAGGAVCADFVARQGISEVYAFHNMSGYPKGAVCLRTGTMNCASRGMVLRFTGAPAHASTPHLGHNPAFAVAQIVQTIPDLIRPEDHRGLVLCTVVQMDVGEPAFGMSASRGALLLTLRAHYEAELDALQQALEALAQKLAERDGLALSIGYEDVFPETSNHPHGVERVRDAAQALGFPLVEMEEPMRASEDFGYYLKKTPGAIFLLGNGPDYPPIHSAAFDFPDDALEPACALFRALL